MAAAAARGNLLDILRKFRPPPGNTGRGAVDDGYAGDLRRYRQKKTRPEGPGKVGSAGERGLRAHTHPGAQPTLSWWSLQV